MKRIVPVVILIALAVAACGCTTSPAGNGSAVQGTPVTTSPLSHQSSFDRMAENATQYLDMAGTKLSGIVTALEPSAGGVPKQDVIDEAFDYLDDAQLYVNAAQGSTDRLALMVTTPEEQIVVDKLRSRITHYRKGISAFAAALFELEKPSPDLTLAQSKIDLAVSEMAQAG
jgi:hypothetical protein